MKRLLPLLLFIFFFSTIPADSNAQDYALINVKISDIDTIWIKTLRKVKEKPLSQWGPSTERKDAKNAEYHFGLFKSGLPEIKNVKKYVAVALSFKISSSRPKGTVSKKLKNGDSVFYYEKENIFVSLNRKGEPTTMFRPKEKNTFYTLVCEEEKYTYIGYEEKQETSKNKSVKAKSIHTHYLKSYHPKPNQKTWLSKGADKFKKVASSKWAAKKNLSSVDNAKAKWEKHKKAFPEIKNLQEYIAAAHKFKSLSLPDKQEKKMQNGDLVVFEYKSNVCVVYDKKGLPKTMFRPSDGLLYFEQVGVDKKVKYEEKWIAVNNEYDDVANIPELNQSTAPKTPIENLAFQAKAATETTHALYRKLASKKSWDAAESVMVTANIISLKEASKFNAFKDLIKLEDAPVEELMGIPKGYIVGFFKIDSKTKKERLIHVMISLGDGKAAGVNNKLIGLGNNRKWEEIDFSQIFYNASTQSFNTTVGNKSTEIFPRMKNPIGKTENAITNKDYDDVANIPELNIEDAYENYKSEHYANYQQTSKTQKSNTNNKNDQPIKYSSDPALNPAMNKSLINEIKINQWTTDHRNDPNRSASQRAEAFYKENKDFFPEIKSVKEYVAVAHVFLRGSHLTANRFHLKSNGDIILYDTESNILAAYNYKGLPYFMTRPKNSTDHYAKLLDPYPKSNNYEPDNIKPPSTLTGSTGDKYKTMKMKGHENEDKGKYWEGRTTRYLNKEQRRKFEVFVHNGKLVDYKDELLDTRGSSGALKNASTDMGIFVMDENGRIYMTKFPILTQFHPYTIPSFNLPIRRTGSCCW